MKSPFIQQIRFYWEKSAWRKKGASEGSETPTFKPSLIRGKTLGTDAVVAEFLQSSGLKDVVSASSMAIYIKDLLKSMLEGVLTDGRSRRIDDYFTMRLDMKGTASAINEPYNPYKHKFTINFQKARQATQASRPRFALQGEVRPSAEGVGETECLSRQGVTMSLPVLFMQTGVRERNHVRQQIRPQDARADRSVLGVFYPHFRSRVLSFCVR